MDQETELLTNAYKASKIQLEAALNYVLTNAKDNSEASEKVRKEGNDLFSQKNLSHELLFKVLDLYNKSACLAPNGSRQLASAIANRSAFLLYVGKYKECIQDVQKALKMTDSTDLKVKLLCRQVECLKNLGDDTHEKVLEEAQSLVDDIDDCNKNKQMLQEIIRKVSKFVVKEAKIIHEPVILPITDNVLDKVCIRHNDKYGRHLVAQQNYEPGDIILVEKVFVSSVESTHYYTVCHHCLEVCWSGVPCKHCDWALFCSQDCSDRAWQEYHDVECSVGQLISQVINISWRTCSMSLKILIKAIKNAGSVENLKAQLEAVDECTDVCSRGFYKNGTFVNNHTESFYSLTKMPLSETENRNISLVTLLFLIGLLKHPQLKTIYCIENIQDLISSKDLVFLGSLLIKLTEIQFNNHFPILGNTTKTSRGFCVTPLFGLVNHSCYPNATVRFTKDGKAILFALQPLEKTSQIFIPYAEMQYHSVCLKDRKEALERRKIECHCQPCTEFWPPVIANSVDKNIFNDSKDEAFLRKACQGIAALIKRNDFKTALENLGPKVTLAFKHLKQPSVLTCGLQIMIHECIEQMYNSFALHKLEKCKSSK